MERPLSDTQSKIFNFIDRYTQQHGRPPTNREIGAAELFAYLFDQRTVDIESVVYMLDITKLVGLMALGGLAGSDDDGRNVVEAGHQCGSVRKIRCTDGLRPPS